MNIPTRCDVVVIGGGPAGSMAATFLSRKGYEVVLLEKRKHPRYQVGESLIPHFWKYTDLVGVTDQIEADGFVQKAGDTVAWNGTIRQFAFRNFGHTRPPLHVERDRFDHILLQHARARGAQVVEEVSALAADLRDGAPVTVRYQAAGEGAPGEITCRFIVDASGQHAVIAKQLGMRVIDEDFRFMSIWGYFLGSKYVGADGRAHPFERLRTSLPTTFVSSIGAQGDGGWMWHIPLRETTSVGLVLPLEQMKSLRATDEALEAFFLRKCAEIPYLDRLLEHARYCEGSLHVIRDYSYRPTNLTGPGFFLIGDAAAFIDPIFSVGLVVAMYSAYIAAWAIDRSLRDPNTVAENQAIFASQFRGRLEVARSLALPRYATGGGASDLAQRSIRFERSLEQELMYVVSTLTTRSESFVDVALRKDGERITSSRYRTLEEITF